MRRSGVRIPSAPPTAETGRFRPVSLALSGQVIPARPRWPGESRTDEAGLVQAGQAAPVTYPMALWVVIRGGSAARALAGVGGHRVRRGPGVANGAPSR